MASVTWSRTPPASSRPSTRCARACRKPPRTWTAASQPPSRPPEMALPNRPRVGYLGPEGTFSEQALLASARPDSVLPVPRESIYDVVTALREGEVEYALVPIENSLEGSISVTLDLLA